MWRALAPSSEATWCTSVLASPATRPPRRCTISPSVSGPATVANARSLRGRLALERLDHLVGDVDSRAREDGVLEDDVELLLLGDLPDDAVRLLDDLGELLVAALIQVLAELALLPLEFAVQVAEIALLGAALRLAHGDGVLLHVLLHALQLIGDARELLVALLELRLDLFLRALRRRRVAQDALGVDEAELADRRGGALVLRERRAARECGREHEKTKREAKNVHACLESGTERELSPLDAARARRGDSRAPSPGRRRRSS